MRYMFPRQFGLHNAFTSKVDHKESAMQFKDYTLREQEIKRAQLTKQKSTTTTYSADKQCSLPKRLRGAPQKLVEALRKRHIRCPYATLMQHYCPTQGARVAEPIDSSGSIFDLATPPAKVSAFCRSIVSHVFPGAFWGEGEQGQMNKAVVLNAIHQFIMLRRYEGMTMHDVLQGISTSTLLWLDHPKQPSWHRLSATDLAKRRDIFCEIVYYLFDSFVIPLISSNFHVTESSVHRNQLFYFRHDVWKALSEPALSSLKMDMFEELKPGAVKRILARRSLGTSQIRLLPKASGLRPIINLRRRVLSNVNGRMILGKSINSIMIPAFNVLNYEKTTEPARLGSSIFSADEIFPGLQDFRANLGQRGLSGKPLFFAKVDVRSCFDTIPQKPLVHMLESLFSASEYSVGRYAELKLLGRSSDSLDRSKVAWKFHGRALPVGQELSLSQIIEEARGRRGAIFVDSVVRKHESRAKIIDILKEHVEKNVVQIGKTYYRQKAGIPQGSIVSSLLCSFFYAELEQTMLGFLNNGDCLLLRLIDDFLLISTREVLAKRFIRTMHRGIPEYGLSVKTDKSLINFDMSFQGDEIKRLSPMSDFPYCGNTINTATLNISKDKGRRSKSSKSVVIE